MAQTFIIVDFRTSFSNGKAVDMVCLAPPGEAFERTNTWHRIKDLTPPENPTTEQAESPTYAAMIARWEQIGPAYDKWRKGEEIPDNGMPLAAWSGVSPEQAALLKKMGARTVEAVAELNPESAAKMPFPNARKLPELAKEFLASRGTTELQTKLEAALERMAAMEELLESQPKRGPGRPRKEAVEAA